jgi:hypothetical protein
MPAVWRGAGESRLLKGGHGLHSAVATLCYRPTALAPHLARCAKGQDHVVLDLAGLNPFARIEPPDPHASVERRDVGRLGVFLITQLADRFDYARAGERNRVTVELPATKSA